MIGSLSSSPRSPFGFRSNSSTSPFGIEAMKCSEAAKENPPDQARSGWTISTAPRAISVEAEFDLVAGDRSGERVGDPGAAVDVVGRDRLLDSIELIGLECPAHLDRKGGAPGAIDVDRRTRGCRFCPQM
jgi:hypothetical protein